MSRLMRFCITQRLTRRGAGLGNELHGWAKAHLAAEVLDAKPFAPAWGRSYRGYRTYFNTSRFDWLHQLLLISLLPTFVSMSSIHEYGRVGLWRRCGGIRRSSQLADEASLRFPNGRNVGGMSILRPAFPFVRKVLNSAEGTVRNLSNMYARIPAGSIVIVVHVRRGDFTSEISDMNKPAWAQWNWGLPLDWYINVCKSIANQLQAPHSFVLFTDGSPEELGSLIREIGPITLFDQEMNVCSDLLAMASADLLICSRSSFSIRGAALSERPYIWPAERVSTQPGTTLPSGTMVNRLLEERTQAVKSLAGFLSAPRGSLPLI